MKFTLITLLLSVSFLSCDETEMKTQKKVTITELDDAQSQETTEIKVDETLVTSIEPPIAPNIPSYELPGGVLGEDYSKELVATIQNPYNNFDYNLFLVDDERLVLQMMGVVTEVMELLYEIPDVNVNAATTYSLDFANLSNLTSDGEVFDDEFIIQYETIEINSGVEGGYENEYNGLVILDTQNERIMANLFLSEREMSYQAPDNMPVDAHGKSFDGSTFVICDKESTFTLREASFSLSDIVYSSENAECDPFFFQSGEYAYNQTLKCFECISIIE